MLYLVEMGFPHPERLAEWHEWYLAHIRVLLTVPGFRASQRFEAVVDNPSPYLALHEVPGRSCSRAPLIVAAAALLPSASGMICRPTGTANLLAGIDETPEVPPDKYVLLLRDVRDIEVPAAVTWLRGIGLDRTIAECGLAVIDDPSRFEGLARRDDRIRLYRPISEKIRTQAH